MKRIATKTGAMFGVVLVLFTMFAALPVYADDYKLEDWLTGWGGDLFWGTMDQLYKYVDYTTYGPSKDDVVVYRNTDPSFTGGGGFGGSGGGSGGGGGRDHSILTQPRNYYANSTVQTYQQTDTTSTNIDKRTYNVKNSGNTYNTSTVNYSYYEGNDTYYINVDNSVTNNNRYEITEIYYNNTYNTYNIYTTNSHNYYLTYSPTFVNITYLDTSTGAAVSNIYYYQLPDGRNSWDLTRDEAFGMYYIYNGVNYETVVEDSKTKGLFHLDGSMADESTHNATATYTKGGSHNYVEHSGFERALYWGADSEQALNFKTGGGTLEFMLYTAAPTVLPALKKTRANSAVDGIAGETWIDVSRWPTSSIYDFLDDGYIAYNPTGGDMVYTSRQTYFSQYYTETTYDVRKEIGALVSSGGSNVIPLYLHGSVVMHRDTKIYKEAVSGAPAREKRIEFVETVNAVSGNIGIMVSANNSRGWEFRKLPTGSWNYISVSGGNVYVNGLKWDVVGATGVGGTFSIEKPKEWNNYWYLDEVRMSSGALYTDTYIPQGHPFDTNKVLVLPDEGKHGDIAIKSNIPVKTMRVGGARPTYPAVGDVYISVEKSTTSGTTKHLVKSVQQYQTGGWQPVDASIYMYTEWVHLKDYNLKAFTLDELPKPNDATLQKFEGALVKFNGPADAIQKILVHGKTYELGSGPRGPDNPYSVYGIENSVIKVNGTAYTMPTVTELFAGDWRSSEGGESHGMLARTFDGTENFQKWGNANTTTEFASDALGIPTLPNNDTIPTAISTHFASPTSPGNLWNASAPGFSLSYRFFFRTEHTTPAEFKSWLAAQSGLGKPVRVAYKLDEPAVALYTPTKFTNEAGQVTVEGPPGMEVWAYAYSGSGEDTYPGTPGDWGGWWDKIKDTIKDITGNGSGGGSGGDEGGNWWDGIDLGEGLWGLIESILGGIVKILGLLVDGLTTIIGMLFEGLGEMLGFTERFGAFIGAAFTFIPPEIITVLVVGLALAVILMIINFFR